MYYHKHVNQNRIVLYTSILILLFSNYKMFPSFKEGKRELL